MKTDPVCGMRVDETKALSAERDGLSFYFCSESCRREFRNQAEGSQAKASSSCHGNHGGGGLRVAVQQQFENNPQENTGSQPK